MPLTIVEVIKRAAQGRSAPYICRGDDGCVYFVKNRSLPRRELVAEWLAACLAEALGLPIPPFCIAEVPTELVESAMGAWLGALGDGPAFASQRAEATELSWQQVDDMPETDKALIVAFDWWVQNMDRTLSRHGGNPNMLWRTQGEDGRVVVIDHNLAFDLTFDVTVFVDSHAFGASFKRLVGDFIERERVRQLFTGVLPRAQEACATIPEEWHFIDPECTLPASWTVQEFIATLNRCLTEDQFWNFPS